MWSARVLLKYWLIQLPGAALVFALAWALAAHFGWPRSVAWAALAFWIFMDAALYPLVWRGYDSSDAASLGYPREGAVGVVVSRLAPEGMVRIDGELWKAEPADGQHIEEREIVRVTGRDDMTLIVEATEPRVPSGTDVTHPG